MQTEALKTVIEACLDQAQDAPVPKRIKLYRGLAEFCGDMQQAAHFNAAARELEDADARCRELALIHPAPPVSALNISPRSTELAREIVNLGHATCWANCESLVTRVATLIELSRQP